MVRKFLLGTAYTLLIVCITYYITSMYVRPSATEAITELQKQFIADPEGTRAEVEQTISAVEILRDFLSKHDFYKVTKGSPQLYKSNQEPLNEAHVLLTTMRLANSCEDSCTVPCKCTGKCDCVSALCCGKTLVIPDEVAPPASQKTDSGLVPHPPSLDF